MNQHYLINSKSKIMNGKSIPELKEFIVKQESKLKDCPFCGGDAFIENTHTPYYWVECNSCGAQVSSKYKPKNEEISEHEKSIRGAVKAWNQRF